MEVAECDRQGEPRTTAGSSYSKDKVPMFSHAFCSLSPPRTRQLRLAVPLWRVERSVIQPVGRRVSSVSFPLNGTAYFSRGLARLPRARNLLHYLP